MRAATVQFVVALGALVLWPAVSAAQQAPAPDPAPPPAATPEPSPGSTPTPQTESSPLPPPVAGTAVDLTSGSPTGAPAPTAQPTPGDDWHFFTHGYFRAPLRVGVGRRPACGAGQMAGTVIDGVPCAGPGQSTTNLHSPFLPDDQYLDWRYTRQWEQDWTEVFLNYGNSHVVGTVGFQAYNFSDAGFNDTNAQLGIAQGYVTVTPDIGVSRVRLKWRVGSFWEKYGQAGDYDAGAYDTYMFGRTHQIGESLGAEIDAGDFTLKLTHGIGAKLEQVAAGNAPTAGSPGFTLLDHFHAGVAYKKLIDANLHYLVSWAQDARATPTTPDGKIWVAGGEVRRDRGRRGRALCGVLARRRDGRGRRGPGDRGDPLARRRGSPDGQWAHRQLPGSLHQLRAQPTSAPAPSTPSNSPTTTASASSTGSSTTRAPASGATGWT